MLSKSPFQLYAAWFFLLLAGASVGAAQWLVSYRGTVPDVAYFANVLEDRLHKAEKEVDAWFTDSVFIHTAADGKLAERTAQILDKKPYSIFIYSEGELIYWSRNGVMPLNNFEVAFLPQRVSKLLDIRKYKFQLIKNYHIRDTTAYSLVALIPLHQDYPFENRYLPAHFPLMPEAAQTLFVSENPDDYPILDAQGKVLAFVATYQSDNYKPHQTGIALLWLLGCFLGLLALHRTIAFVLRKRAFVGKAFIFPLLLIGLRWLCFELKLPAAVYEWTFFSTPLIGGGLLMPTFGDWCINVLLLFGLAIWFFRRQHFSSVRALYPMMQMIGIGLYTFCLGLGLLPINALLKVLVMQPDISFEIYNVLDLNYLSLTSWATAALLLLSHFLVALRLTYLTNKLSVAASERWWVVSVALSLQLLLFFILLDTWEAAFLGMFSIAYQMLLSRLGLQRRVPLSSAGIWLFFFAALTAGLLYNSSQEQKLQARVNFAKNLALNKDIAAENSFLKINNALPQDSYIRTFFRYSYILPSDVYDKIMTAYLDPYFLGKYDYEVHLFYKNGQPVRGESALFSDYEWRTDLAATTNIPYLFLDYDFNNKYIYLARYPIYERNNDLLGYVVIELRQKTVARPTVFVDLLSQSKNEVIETPELKDYAIYKNKELIISLSGNAPLVSPLLQGKVGTYTSTQEAGLSLVVYHGENNIQTVVTAEKTSLFTMLTLFSYIFFLLFLFLLIVLAINRLTNTIPAALDLRFTWRHSLRGRLQGAVVLLILLVFGVTGAITFIFFQQGYTDYNTAQAETRVSGIKTAIEQFINRTTDSLALPDLNELSLIHALPIHLYDAQGKLLASSEMRLFDRRLVAPLLHPQAFRRLNNSRGSIYKQMERIGDFRFNAAYTLIKRDNRETVAFLSVPIEQPGNVNRREVVGSFIVTLLNVYVLMLLVAGVIAIAIANSITQPLQVLSEKLRTLRLGQRNEPLLWNNDDEIGQLIERYNEMTRLLEESAQQLALSQKESAWREMAKQVAHEIKNPLTPMKLSIQHLQRVNQSDDERYPALQKRVLVTLLEQIDHLAHIASEFSNFAKMPKAESAPLLLNDFLSSFHALFEHEEEVSVSLNLQPMPMVVFADKNQLLQVLNNLVKNAIQAIPEDRKGKVEISLSQENGKARIAVADNGCGIPLAQQETVFTPNFTTKSSGMGLGLAICRNIIESAQGKIWVESVPDQGATFFVELPLISNATEAAD